MLIHRWNGKMILDWTSSSIRWTKPRWVDRFALQSDDEFSPSSSIEIPSSEEITWYWTESRWVRRYNLRGWRVWRPKLWWIFIWRRPRWWWRRWRQWRWWWWWRRRGRAGRMSSSQLEKARASVGVGWCWGAIRSEKGLREAKTGKNQCCLYVCNLWCYVSLLCCFLPDYLNDDERIRFEQQDKNRGRECCAKPFLITGFIVVCFLRNLLLFLSLRAVFPDV